MQNNSHYWVGLRDLFLIGFTLLSTILNALAETQPLIEKDFETALSQGESAVSIAQRFLEKDSVDPLELIEMLTYLAPESAVDIAVTIAQAVPDEEVPTVAAITARDIPDKAVEIALAVTETLPQSTELIIQLIDAVSDAVPSAATAIESAFKEKIVAAEIAEQQETQAVLNGQGAGILAMIEGEVQLITADGSPQKAETGAELSNGMTIKTANNASAVIQMPDESSYVIEANSQFKIVNYHFIEVEPTNDKSEFSLLEGMFRFTSGKIGKRNPEKVQYHTPTATMGIRGTEGTLRYYSTEEQSYVHVVSGQMSMFEEKQRIPVNVGMYGLTKTGIRTDVPTKLTTQFKAVKSLQVRHREAAVMAQHRLSALHKEIVSGKRTLTKAEAKTFEKELKKLRAVIKKGTKQEKKKRGTIQYETPDLTDPLNQTFKKDRVYEQLMDYTKQTKKGRKKGKALKAMQKKFERGNKIKKSEKKIKKKDQGKCGKSQEKQSKGKHGKSQGKSGKSKGKRSKGKHGKSKGKRGKGKHRK